LTFSELTETVQISSRLAYFLFNPSDASLLVGHPAIARFMKSKSDKELIEMFGEKGTIRKGRYTRLFIRKHARKYNKMHLFEEEKSE